MLLNNHGHSDWSGLFFLMIACCIGAALVEGSLLALFLFTIFKWKLWLLSVILGLAAVIFPTFLIKKYF